MKRFLITAAMAVGLAIPGALAVTQPAQAQVLIGGHHHGWHGGWHRGYERGRHLGWGRGRHHGWDRRAAFADGRRWHRHRW